MAGSDLLAALSGMTYRGIDEPFGVAANAIGQSIPLLTNPYASTGSNLANTVGAGLIAALLGGLAHNEAQADNAALLPLENKFITGTPDEQAALIKQEPRLAPLQGVMLMNALDAQQAGATELAKTKAQLDPDVIAAQAKAAGDKKQAELQAESNAFGYNPTRAKAEQDILSSLSGRPETKEYSAAVPILQTMEKVKDVDSRSADLAYLYGLPKLLDPSVVKEGEMQLMMQNMPGLEQWANNIKAVFSGEAKLDPGAREAILRIAREKVAGFGEQYNAAALPYQAQVDSMHLDPSHALPFPKFTPFAGSGGLDPGSAIAELKRRGLVP